MSEKTDFNERKLSGTARLCTGFVIGALFALAPMYYFYMGREAALSHAAPGTSAPAEQPVEAQAAPAVGALPFASRMTYELSRLPEEPLAVVARIPAPTVVPPPRAPAASVQSVESLETRVADARPISTRPPAPRDRTAAIEQETQKREYGDATRGDVATVRPPKVFAGREVDLSKSRLPETPTKPITTDVAFDSRADAAGAPVAGVSPITRPPESSEMDVVATAKTVSAAPRTAAKPPGGTSVDSRLAATREWLDVAAKSTHTIQLMGTSSEAHLDGQLKSLAEMLEPGRLYVYRTLAQGKPSITVVYGEYPDRKSALQALDKLPPALLANKPVLRTVNGIRTELKQHKTGG